MNPPGLTSLPPELLFFLFLFLSEDDIFSLSHVCVFLYHVMNDDQVWKRFIPDQVRGLEFQPQQVSVDNVLPDQGLLCENRKHYLRKRRLLSIWRSQRPVKHESTHDDGGYVSFLFYKYNHIILELNATAQLWDISSIPVVCSTMTWPEGLSRWDHVLSCFVIGDNLVIALSPRVWVYQININEGCFSFLYAFCFKSDSVACGPLPTVEYDGGWDCCGSGNYLAFYERKRDSLFHPRVHVWDITNASKVGVFTAPQLVQSTKLFHAGLKDQLVLKTVPRGVERYECAYLKFNFLTLKFCSNVFKMGIFMDVLFYTDHCIKLVDEDDCVMSCELFEFDSSAKLTERTFDKFRSYEHSASDNILIVNCELKIFIVNALTLEILNTVFHLHYEVLNMNTISVFGFRYLALLGHADDLSVWDIRDTPPSLIENTQNQYLMEAKGIDPFPKLIEVTRTMHLDKGIVKVWHFW